MDEKVIETLKTDAGFFLGLLRKMLPVYDHQEETKLRIIGSFSSLEYIRMILREFDYWTYEDEFQEVRSKLIQLRVIGQA